MRKTYLKYLKYGVDVVIGHHPHVPQGYEAVGKKMIFYSLGNFIFDTDYQRIQAQTDVGIVVKLNFSKKSFDWTYLPIKIDRENHQIVNGKTPINFKNITGKEYRIYAPIVVLRYIENIKRAAVFLAPKYEKNSDKDWADYFIRNKGIKTYKTWLKYVKKCQKKGYLKGDKQLLDYILE